MTQFRNQRTKVVWDVPEGSEAYKRCKRLSAEFEEISPEPEKPKKPEKSGP
jgi:hypothetical protein